MFIFIKFRHWDKVEAYGAIPLQSAKYTYSLYYKGTTLINLTEQPRDNAEIQATLNTRRRTQKKNPKDKTKIMSSTDTATKPGLIARRYLKSFGAMSEEQVYKMKGTD